MTRLVGPVARHRAGLRKVGHLVLMNVVQISGGSYRPVI